MEHLSLQELLGEPAGGGLLCWKSGRIWEGGLRGWASPSLGAPLGSLTVDLSIGDLCWKVHSPVTLRDSWWRAVEMKHFSLWALCEENLQGKAPLLETMKVM